MIITQSKYRTVTYKGRIADIIECAYDSNHTQIVWLHPFALTDRWNGWGQGGGTCHKVGTIELVQQGHKSEGINRTQTKRFYTFVFNGKEKDYESGFHYYGARYYWSEVLTGWLSVDPMADKYPFISPYAYCAWNPVKLVDPDGREIDDYFSYTGKYLGSDNAKTDNIRIIEESQWDKLSVNGTIEHTLGRDNSKSFSSAQSKMSEDEQLEVYRHYNPTKCELFSTSSSSHPGNSGMVTVTKNKRSRIGVYLKDNFKGIAVADHAFEIVNMFVHEKQHVINAAKNPHMANYEDEASAFDAQVHHDSWIHCRPEYKHAVTNYARKVTFLGNLYIDLFDPYADIWNH